MKLKTLKQLNDVDRAIIKFRGICSAWSAEHDISYHEMYTIRDKGYCIQKQIRSSYLLPRQTMNNVITALRKNGILTVSEEYSMGREKAFVLTRAGSAYAKPFLDPLDAVGSRAVELLGGEKLEPLTALMPEYDRALQKTPEGSR